MSATKFKSLDALCWASSLGLGLLAGYFDSNVEEVLLTVLLVSACGVALGLIRPAGAWRWALTLGVGVFLFHVFEQATGRVPRYPAEPNIFVTLVVVAPAFAGVYGGAALRRMLEQVWGGNV
jgi:uncharacterized membrane protein YphA (DoxX/SURF4 family)